MAYRPTVEEWTEHLKAPAADGGQSCSVIDPDVLLQDRAGVIPAPEQWQHRWDACTILAGTESVGLWRSLGRPLP